MMTAAPYTARIQSSDDAARVVEGLRLGGLHFQYLHICARKLWLKMKGFEASAIRTYEIHSGRTLNQGFKGEEVRAGTARIDAITAERVVIERKRSIQNLESAIAQLRFYLWICDPTAKQGWTGRVENYEGSVLAEIRFDQDEMLRFFADISAIVEVASAGTAPCCAAASLCARCGFREICFA